MIVHHGVQIASTRQGMGISKKQTLKPRLSNQVSLKIQAVVGNPYQSLSIKGTMFYLTSKEINAFFLNVIVL